MRYRRVSSCISIPAWLCDSILYRKKLARCINTGDLCVWGQRVSVGVRVSSHYMGFHHQHCPANCPRLFGLARKERELPVRSRSDFFLGMGRRHVVPMLCPTIVRVPLCDRSKENKTPQVFPMTFTEVDVFRTMRGAMFSLMLDFSFGEHVRHVFHSHAWSTSSEMQCRSMRCGLRRHLVTATG